VITLEKAAHHQSHVEKLHKGGGVRPERTTRYKILSDEDFEAGDSLWHRANYRLENCFNLRAVSWSPRSVGLGMVSNSTILFERCELKRCYCSSGSTLARRNPHMFNSNSRCHKLES